MPQINLTELFKFAKSSPMLVLVVLVWLELRDMRFEIHQMAANMAIIAGTTAKR